MERRLFEAIMLPVSAASRLFSCRHHCLSPTDKAMTTQSRLRLSSVLLAAAMLVPMAGCDTVSDTQRLPEAFSMTFSFTGNQMVVRDDGHSAYYERTVNGLTREYVEEGLVLLYADGGLLDPADAGQTWTALPLTVGIDENGDGFVDYTVTYTFSFAIQRVYVDILGSSPLNFGGIGRTDVRAVFIPGRLANQMASTVDLQSYQAVAEALGLDR